MHHLPPTDTTLATTVPVALLVVAALGALAAWWGLHRFVRPRRRWEAIPLFGAGVALGSIAIWFALQSFERLVVLEGRWGSALTAVAAASLIECVALLYRLERLVVTPWTGRLIVALRIVFVALLLLVLAEPTFTWKVTEPDERIVAVLVDDSASMDQSDPQATSAEKLDLADLLLPGMVPARLRPVQMAQSLHDVGRRIAVELAWLRQLAQTDSEESASKTYDDRREQAMVNLRECSATLQRFREELSRLAADSGIPPSMKDSLNGVASVLADQVGKNVTALQQAIAGADLQRLRSDAAPAAIQLDQALTSLARAADRLRRLDGAVADAAYQRLSPELRKSVDHAAAQPRRSIARAVLMGRPDTKPGLAHQLAGRYTVRFYRFAAAPGETTLAAWSTPQERAPAESAEKTLLRQRTDLAAALQQVKADVPSSKLSGVVVISDGRHNAKTPLDPIAHALALQNTPVASVLVGSTAPVIDAAVTSASAPSSVQLSDRVTVRAEVKFVGLAGQTAAVTLTHAGQTVDAKKIQIPSDMFRTEVELGDTPKKTGLTSYTVQITPLATERVKENNARSVHLQVTDDPIRLLLIEGRPRWEYRYLRNLFADRDKSVRLQYVLMHPERIEGAPVATPIHASARRGLGEAEATALPAKADDWFLFDTIILGDVSPHDLGPAAVDILKRFVGERGGRLIVIAGQNYMPHAFASSPLAEMLPVICAPSAGAIAAPIEPGYYVRLTPEGERHAVTQLDNNAEDNRLLWDSLPEQHLRHPIRGVQPGATVLAFAMPFDMPEFFQRTAGSPEEAERLARQRKEFMNRHALLAVQPFGSGQVLFLGFDGTWRFRFGTGDTLHHRFWGQVMRWATIDKLPAGTDLARIGTDRPVYEPGEPVVVRARLSDKNRAAVVTPGASVVVLEGQREVLRKHLEPIAGQPGRYESDLGPFAPGREYRVALRVDDPARPELVAAANQASTRIVVTQPQSLEMTELSADRDTLDLVARKTNGIVVSPGECDAVMTVLGPASREIVHEDRYPLWHSYYVLLTLLGLVTTEWILRKKGGLT